MIKKILVVLTGIVIWFVPPVWDISTQAWHLFAVFFSTILAVLINAFPILLASLFALASVVLTGTLDVKLAFSGFSESFMLLILSAFLVAKAVIKSGLGRRVAMLLIRRFGKNTLRLAYCIAVTDTLIAPAIPSNTARSGILFPIVNALALDTGSHPTPDSRKTTGSYLMMCGITSLTISSALWMTAMAGNLITVEIAQQFGVHMTFGGWFLAASLPCIIGLIILPYALYIYFPPGLKETPEAMQAADSTLQQMGPMNKKEWITLLVFLGMVTMWGLAGIVNINTAIVGILGLAMLIATGVYRLEYLRAEGGDALETYIWFSILYMLSSQLNDLGFMHTIGVQISGLLQDLHWISAYLLLTILYVAIHYLFVSQTAQLLALFAVFLEVAILAGVPAALMAFMLAFATNYFSVITPQASTGNVIFIGSGYLLPGEVYRAGGMVTVINLIIFLLATPWILWVAS
ncbi:MAG: DASS family sodium-coupled anion symporter [Saprospiraceae bacterium]|nr:DASS family sodium-coupled anion symporter [Saprospiraceae bacterium]